MDLKALVAHLEQISKAVEVLFEKEVDDEKAAALEAIHDQVEDARVALDIHFENEAINA